MTKIIKFKQKQMEITCRSDRKQQPFTVKLDNFATFDALLTQVMPEIDLIQEYK